MKRLVLPVLGIALGSLLFAAPASAQSFEVAQAGAQAVLVSKPEIVAEALKKFDTKKAAIQETMKQEFSRPIGSGMTLYVLNPRVGNATFRFVSAGTFEIVVTENVVPFCLSKPADSAEPAGEIRFDIVVRGTMHVPTKETPQIAVIDATINTANVSVNRKSGEADPGFEKLSELFKKMNPDRNALRSAFDRHRRMEFNDQLNKGLRPINKKIAELVKKGMTQPVRWKKRISA